MGVETKLVGRIDKLNKGMLNRGKKDNRHIGQRLGVLSLVVVLWCR